MYPPTSPPFKVKVQLIFVFCLVSISYFTIIIYYLVYFPSFWRIGGLTIIIINKNKVYEIGNK